MRYEKQENDQLEEIIDIEHLFNLIIKHSGSSNFVADSNPMMWET